MQYRSLVLIVSLGISLVACAGVQHKSDKPAEKIMGSEIIDGWAKIAKNDNLQLTAYADPASIQWYGNRASILTMNDYSIQRPTPDRSNTFMSEKVLKLYDCETSKSQVGKISMYSGNMGKGDTTVWESGRGQQFDWNRVDPGKIDYDFLKFVCAKKPK